MMWRMPRLRRSTSRLTRSPAASSDGRCHGAFQEVPAPGTSLGPGDSSQSRQRRSSGNAHPRWRGGRNAGKVQARVGRRLAVPRRLVLRPARIFEQGSCHWPRVTRQCYAAPSDDTRNRDQLSCGGNAMDTNPGVRQSSQQQAYPRPLSSAGRCGGPGARPWPHAQGTVTRSWTETVTREINPTDSAGPTTIRINVRVNYRYLVGDTAYSGDRVTFFPSTMSHGVARLALEHCDRYAAGTALDVR